MRIWFEASAVKHNFVFRKTAAVDLLLRESHHMPEHKGHIVVHLLGSYPGFLKCSSGNGSNSVAKDLDCIFFVAPHLSARLR